MVDSGNVIPQQYGVVLFVVMVVTGSDSHSEHDYYHRDDSYSYLVESMGVGMVPLHYGGWRVSFECQRYHDIDSIETSIAIRN